MKRAPMSPSFRHLALAAMLAGSSVPAWAQDGLDLSANAGVVSDYRFRGISLSDRDPALQGGIDLEAGPVFAGAWGSTIAEYGGAEVELDFYGGLQGSLGGLDWRAGAYAYLYPGGEGVDYVELVAQVERTVGPLAFGLEAAFAPEQANVDHSNVYFGASSSFEAGGGWSVNARGGYEDGFYARKWDWEAGVAYSAGPLTGTVAYVDSNHGAADEAGRLGQGGLVVSLLAEF